MKRRHKKRTNDRTALTSENELTITRLDQFLALIGIALGIYGISYLINTQDDLRFWLNQQEYYQTEFTVNAIDRVPLDDDVHIYLVGTVARTNQEIRIRDWLIYDPRIKSQTDYSVWSDRDDKGKIGVRFPIWFANKELRIYYVSEFAEKPSNFRAIQCLLLNLTFFGLSFYCLARGMRKAIRLQASDMKTTSNTEAA